MSFQIIRHPRTRSCVPWSASLQTLVPIFWSFRLGLYLLVWNPELAWVCFFEWSHLFWSQELNFGLETFTLQGIALTAQLNHGLSPGVLNIFFFNEQVHKVYMRLTSPCLRIKPQFVECFNLICMKQLGREPAPLTLQRLQFSAGKCWNTASGLLMSSCPYPAPALNYLSLGSNILLLWMLSSKLSLNGKLWNVNLLYINK